ncbi:MAG TPA: hypothetical protein VFF65_04520, partial [Phycisphaerales bacterium]|nr:hypothetical protein [Phycisphaerales bacterium]
DFRAVQAKKEEDAEAARGEAAAAAERKTAAALVEVEQSVRRTQRRHTSALSALTLAQEEELEALGAGHSAKLASIAAAAEKARDAAERTLRGVRDETAAAERQVVYNVEVQRAANERRLGLLSGAVDLANGAAVTAGGPGGVAAVAGLGLLAGWLGLSKPGDKKAAAEADKVRATLVNVARAVELLPPEKRADTKAAIDKTTTDADDLLIDRLKVDFAIRPAA